MCGCKQSLCGTYSFTHMTNCCSVTVRQFLYDARKKFITFHSITNWNFDFSTGYNGPLSLSVDLTLAISWCHSILSYDILYYYITPSQMTCNEMIQEFPVKTTAEITIEWWLTCCWWKSGHWSTNSNEFHVCFFLSSYPEAHLFFLYTFWYQIEFEKCKIMYNKCTLTRKEKLALENLLQNIMNSYVLLVII